VNSIEKIFHSSIRLKEEVLASGILKELEVIGEGIAKAIENGNKILLCGNGGSAADAQHLAAEMLVRLRPNINRDGIAAIALAVDTSTITACGNDFGYDELYERMVQSLGKKGDCLIGITTSGNSKNILLAMKQARNQGINVTGFLGSNGGKAKDLCDNFFLVPSYDTGRVQEVHITAGHALMQYIEDRLLKSGYLEIYKKYD
jgi:D-sedoheptulose 7-phosphate isomerase